MKTTKYKSDGKYQVTCGKTIIAKSFIGNDGYEVRILQGMPRNETWDKIFTDCPEFAQNNNMNRDIVPKLFSK